MLRKAQNWSCVKILRLIGKGTDKQKKHMAFSRFASDSCWITWFHIT